MRNNQCVSELRVHTENKDSARECRVFISNCLRPGGIQTPPGIKCDSDVPGDLLALERRHPSPNGCVSIPAWGPEVWRDGGNGHRLGKPVMSSLFEVSD